LPLFLFGFVRTQRIVAYAGHDFSTCNLFSFLLPVLCFARGMVYARLVFFVVANQILDSTRRMVDANIGDSKLCACATRHAPENFLSEISAAQLGKGRAFVPPRCIPSCALGSATETVPVSAPFGFVRVVVFRAWAVRP
jgi:hypothetical protein